MENITNIFGKGIIYDAFDLKGMIYVRCCACMSVLADFLSWANKYSERFTTNIKNADTIVVLGCQVTDLAVLNDLRNCEELFSLYKKDIYLGGCIAQRFDIELPNYVKRLDVVRDLDTAILDKSLVDFAKPFWVKDFIETKRPLAHGNLFRNMYPLKIGAGCHGNCKYCTIRHTRGIYYEKKANDQINEFLQNDNVVIISDAPTLKQIIDWCYIAISNKKEISFRNVEPNIVMSAYASLLTASKSGVLKILHSPIQSCQSDVLKAMNRNTNEVNKFIKQVQELRRLGVICATNIIIDYEMPDGSINPNYDIDFMQNNFDYFVWNPYWNGIWDRTIAEKRFEKYIDNEFEKLFKK